MDCKPPSRRDFLCHWLAGSLTVAGLTFLRDEAVADVMTVPITYCPLPAPNGQTENVLPDQVEGGTRICLKFAVPGNIPVSEAPSNRRRGTWLASLQAPRASEALEFDIRYTTELAIPRRPPILYPTNTFPSAPEQLLRAFPTRVTLPAGQNEVRFEIATNRTLYPIYLTVTATPTSARYRLVAQGRILIVRDLE
jgi:hypothetical protein